MLILLKNIYKINFHLFLITNSGTPVFSSISLVNTLSNYSHNVISAVVNILQFSTKCPPHIFPFLSDNEICI